VHFDPVVPEHQPLQSPRLVDALIDTPEREDDDGEPSARTREGLPPAFRMRHARHYVEQVMGDGPIRTIREITLQDLEEAAADQAVDLHALERSIRAIGVLEPLLVRPRGKRFLVISGAKRLQAARAAGLRTVPCLVQDVDDEMADRIREAVNVRPAPPVPAAPEAPSTPVASAGQPIAGLDFVAALTPAIHAAAGDPLRRSVLGDLAAAEMARASLVAACAEVPEDVAALRRPIDAGDVLREAVLAVLPEARLRGIRLDVTAPSGEYALSADRASVGTAVTSLLQVALALAPHPGVEIQVRMEGTIVRPAMIVHVRIGGAQIDPFTAARLFDADLKPHPCGTSGGVMSSAVRRIARSHGGRADARLDPGGCTLTLVIPKPLGNSD
jgi:hypothetical protein